MSERIKDFSDLSYDTVMEIYSNPDISSSDQQNAYEEIARREESGEIDERKIDYNEDLSSHGYLVDDKGVVHYPTEQLRAALEEGYEGEIPEDWRETLSERAEKVIKQLRTEEEKPIEKSPEKKARYVLKHTDRIKMEQFAGVFPDYFIKNCKKQVEGKQAGETDDVADPNIFQAASEPLFVQLLGGEGERLNKFLPVQSYAIWASVFDDEKRSTDIIYGVKGRDGGWITYSVDVTSSRTGNNEKTIDKKFDESGYTRHGNTGDFTPWTKEIVFCRRGRNKFTEKEAPHFVLSLSNETLKKVASNVILDKNNIPIDSKEDKDVEFMVASEFFEQITMQMASLVNKDSDQFRKLKQLKNLMEEKIFDTIGISPADSLETKNRLYRQKYVEMAKKDGTYANIVTMARRYKKDYKDKLGA